MRRFLISAVNIGPNRFHQNRTARRITSGELSKHRKEFCIR
jgi:hypothetical protein